MSGEPTTEASEAAEAAFIDACTERDMAEAYYRTLETHLREHGCDHDFAEVANADGRVPA